jgi:hypothetical protein
MTNPHEIAELKIERTAPEIKGQSHLQVERRISFANGEFIFSREGRHPYGLHIPSMRISKLRHAEIVFEDGRYWLIRHSKNLIALNGRELERSQRYVLENDDVIVFAGVVKFRVALSAGDTWPVIPKGIWVSSAPYPLVKVNGAPLAPPLSANEFRFLEILHKHAGCTVTRERIFDHVWPNEYATEGQLDHVVHRVRNRLKALGGHEFIVMQRGVGYLLNQLPYTLDDLWEDNSPGLEEQLKVCATQMA